MSNHGYPLIFLPDLIGYFCQKTDVIIKVLFFGMSKDVTGKSNESIELDAQLSVKDFEELLMLKYPGLKDIGEFAIALNEAYASGEQLISNHDTLAIIPPVSGG